MKEDWTEEASKRCQKICIGRRLGAEKTLRHWLGQMKVSVKLVTKRKAQKSTGSTIAQNGTKSEGISQRPSESGSKKRECRSRSGSGKEVL